MKLLHLLLGTASALGIGLGSGFIPLGVVGIAVVKITGGW